MSKGNLTYETILAIGADSFYQAEESCYLMGARLPSIKNEISNQEVARIASATFKCDSIWLGLDVRWRWSDSSPLVFQNLQNALPGNDSFQCVAMNTSSGSWFWQSCLQRVHYFCAFPTVESTSTESTPKMASTSSAYSLSTGTTSSPLQACNIGPQDGDLARDWGHRYELNRHSQQEICQLQDKRKECSHWRIGVITAIGDKENAEKKLDAFKYAMDDITSSCDGDCRIFSITPRSTQTNSPILVYPGSSSGRFALSQQVTAEQVIVDPSDASLQMYNMFKKLGEFFAADALPKNFGSVVFVLTDLNCTVLCHPPLTTHQPEIIDSLHNNDTLLRLIYYGTFEKAACLRSVFAECFKFPGLCDYAVMSSIQSVPGSMYTCMYTPANRALSQAEIIVIAASAALIVLACIALLIFFKCRKVQASWVNVFMKEFRKEAVNHLKTRHRGVTGSFKSRTEEDESQDFYEVGMDNLIILETKLLGSGAFSKVYEGFYKGEPPVAKRQQLASSTNNDGMYKVAIKCLPVYANAENRKDFQEEIASMKQIGYHSHVTSLLGCVTKGSNPLILTDVCDLGDLLSFIRSRKESFSMLNDGDVAALRLKDLIAIAWQISDALSFLASKGFVHRDVAARNVLLCTGLVVKLGDFGMCRKMISDVYMGKSERLPIKWMAPEALKQFQYSYASDVWSFSVLLFELFSLGESPYSSIPPTDILQFLDGGNRLQQTEFCPEPFYQLMERCWAYNPIDRPPIEEVRAQLEILLSNNSEHYGYIAVSSEFSQGTVSTEDYLDRDFSPARRKNATTEIAIIGF
ncbi:unnamed protein product [Caenorhabditis auriculariae]|uniref:Protein kinase domain-containing protein n=1 Tax=Caenorhabditis auriculariae TaxID=2777116 RepID=A0A8S1H9F5_9PELO|nr:unnamed protein product [Caenorhabditis auriculariae]